MLGFRYYFCKPWPYLFFKKKISKVDMTYSKFDNSGFYSGFGERGSLGLRNCMSVKRSGFTGSYSLDEILGRLIVLSSGSDFLLCIFKPLLYLLWLGMSCLYSFHGTA